ncbi:MAG TPA: glycosyltransferase family 4 protein [Anaerolineales bacterium]|nr:glycosyltransferase family 4 protein [Anaerolineales bacterium]
MMKIAILSEKYPPDPGGLSVSTQRLASLLQNSGNLVEVFAPQDSLQPGCKYSVQEGGVIVNRFGAQRRLDDTFADWFELFVDRQVEQPFDLVHGFYLVQAGFLAAYLGNYFHIPSVVSARGNDLDRAVLHPGKAAHILYALQYCTMITANSHELARKAGALAPGKNVEYIPNSVNGDLFSLGQRDEELVQKLEIGNRQVIGFSGEARAKKGLSIQLLAFERIAIRKDVILLLVGGVRSGEDLELLNVFQKRNPKLQIKVVPHHPLDQMPAYYRLMDVFWMPSLRDGMPNALLEAMSCGKAVLATPVGGIVDLLDHPGIGQMIPAGDVPALADATLDLLDQPERRAAMGKAAREWVLDNFSPSRELKANLDVYQRVVYGG